MTYQMGGIIHWNRNAMGDRRKLETAGNAKLWAGEDSGSENTTAIK